MGITVGVLGCLGWRGSLRSCGAWILKISMAIHRAVALFVTECPLLERRVRAPGVQGPSEDCAIPIITGYAGHEAY